MWTTFQCQHNKLGTLTVRALGEDDIPSIIAIEQRSHLTPWSERNFRGSIAGRHLCVGLFSSDQSLIGYAVISVVAGEAELLLFVIDAALHGQKVGLLFIEAVIREMHAQASVIFLEVRAGNVPAITLYEGVGFNQVGDRPGYYDTPWGREDALIYALELG